MAERKRSREELEAEQEHAALPQCVDAEFPVGEANMSRELAEYLERREQYQEACWNDSLVLDGHVPAGRKR